ncbi:MAG: DUF4214 domain-containing protein, partial [Acidobacteriota bacterium]|nr:DUF4214 domain-containing protein [Acidobacteriota bacterium]
WESRPGGKGRPADLLAAAGPLWKPVGPAPTTSGFHGNWGATSGRINAVAVHPTNPRVVIVGASTGGLWRSADGGLTFAPVSDDQVDLAVGSVAFSRSNPSIVYAGMGDLDNSFVGTGVLKSSDGGLTWARVSNASLPARGIVADIAVDPSNPGRVYAAQTVSLDAANNTFASGGFYLSADGGVNWAKTLGGRARSLAVHPSNPQTLYVALSAADGAGQPGVYKSTNGGQTWGLVYASPFGANTRDIRVAVTAADPERVYAYSGARTPREVRLEVSANGGESWTERGTAGVVGLDPGQFGYNTYLHVSPAHADTVYVGSRDIYKSTNGGLSWANLTRNFTGDGGCAPFCYTPLRSKTHPDQQAFAFAPGNAQVIYAGNDGGLSRSTDGGATFHSLNATLSLTQFVHLSLHPTDASRSYGGTQDNGTQRRAPGTNEWVEFNEGDGGRSVINPRDPSMVFSTYIFGNINRNTHHGLSYYTIIATDETFGEGGPGSSPRIAFYPPFVGNGVDSKLYFGTWRLFVCTNCHDPARHAFSTPPADWAAPAGALDLTRGVTLQGTDVLTAIGVARSNTNVIYTGSAFGRAMVSRDGGATWADISAGLPNRVIESISVHPANPSVAYLTVSGYGSGHVFKTTNAGAAWADVSGNLPNVPAGAFLIDPRNNSTVYAGTDIGVFRSTAGGGVWESFNDGMPPAVVTAFAAQANGRIQAATYGRGAYEFVPGLSVVSFSAPAFAASESDGRARLTVTRTDPAAPASVEYATADGTAGERADYTTARGTLLFAAGEATKTLDVPVSDDHLQEPPETFAVTLSNPSGATLGATPAATVTLGSNDAATAPSPVKWESFDSRFFVRQHYLDFLGREPDAPGLNFWKNQIDQCGANAACAEARRINVSAAFFLSIEFQETGYLVYRTQKAAFGDLPGKPVPVTRLAMLVGSRRIGEGVVVGVGDWQARLEANKRAYFEAVAASASFAARHPLSLNPQQFVAALNANAGGALS